jgi:hypothetical protein
MAFVDIVSSIISGGATGIIGAAVSRYADYKNKQLDVSMQKEKFSHEIELRHADARIMELEWSYKDKIAATEAQTHVEQYDSDAFKTALTSEPQRYSLVEKLTNSQNWLMVLLDFVRGAIRPGLTLYLCAITTVVYFQSSKIIANQTVSVQQAVDIYNQITATILYLCTTVVLFWFGCRAKGGKSGR